MSSIVLVLLGVWLALTFDLMAFLGGIVVLVIFMPLLSLYMMWDEQREKTPSD